jgi:hypothetical protein
MTYEQPRIILFNDFQTISLIENGAIFIEQEEDLGLPITYRAIAVNGKLAYVRSLETGRVLLEDPVLIAIVNSIMALCAA